MKLSCCNDASPEQGNRTYNLRVKIAAVHSSVFINTKFATEQYSNLEKSMHIKQFLDNAFMQI